MLLFLPHIFLKCIPGEDWFLRRALVFALAYRILKHIPKFKNSNNIQSKYNFLSKIIKQACSHCVLSFFKFKNCLCIPCARTKTVAGGARTNPHPVYASKDWCRLRPINPYKTTRHICMSLKTITVFPDLLANGKEVVVCGWWKLNCFLPPNCPSEMFESRF